MPIPFSLEVVTELGDDVLDERADGSVLLLKLFVSCVATGLGD